MNHRGADFVGNSSYRERCNKRKRRWRMEGTRPENKRAVAKGGAWGRIKFRASRELIFLLNGTSRALYNLRHQAGRPKPASNYTSSTSIGDFQRYKNE